MWSGGGHRNPPPYYDPPNPYGSLYPNPNPTYQPPQPNVPVLSHHGVPSPVPSGPNFSTPNYGPPPPVYGIQPPAGAVNYQYQNPYQQQPMSGEDAWVTVQHGSPFPHGAIQAMDRPLNNNDSTAKACYVALWNNNGEPVYGRAWNKNGTVEAWFPYGGNEHHSGGVGSFSLLAYYGPPRQNFRYAWVPVNQLNSMCQPVRQQDYVPAVIPDLHIGKFSGEMLGKANLSRRMAWVSHGGQEHHFTDNKFNGAYVLCRVPL